jgi:hypothetical protein
MTLKTDAKEQDQQATNAMQQAEAAEQKAESASDSQIAGNGKEGSDKQNLSDKSKGAGTSTESSETPGEKQNDAASSESAQGRSPGESGRGSEGQDSGEATSADKSGSDTQRQDGGQDGNASPEARFRMLQAKQRALQEQVSQLKQELEALPAETRQ